MLNKITGRYNHRTQVMAYITEAERMISKYGWQNMVVHPHSYAMPITEIIGYLKDYDICTEGSREYAIQLANGLADIMNAWEAHELAPKKTCRIIKSGKVVKINDNDLDMFEGLIEVID